jgi:adenine phosphoribosyltransferase
MSELADRIKRAMVTYPEWPRPGVTFADLSPVYADTELRNDLTQHFVKVALAHEVNTIAAIESRGYLLGMSLADALDLPFVQVRKSGKLPGDCLKVAYSLEYGTAEIEVQRSAFSESSRVLIVDDVLATGGTMKAAAELVQGSGATIAAAAVIVEIRFLNGRNALGQIDVDCVVSV